MTHLERSYHTTGDFHNEFINQWLMVSDDCKDLRVAQDSTEPLKRVRMVGV
jgi:hypothetical protein